MKITKPLIDPFAPVKKPRPADKADQSRHLASADFAKGVEVVEMLDTMPADLWELFKPPVSESR
jgi:hypothetical protein